MNVQHARRHSRGLLGLLGSSAALMLGLAAAVPPLRASVPRREPDPPAAATLDTYTQRTICGFTVLAHPGAAGDALLFRRVLAALTFDLELISQRIPAPALAVLRESPLVITPTTHAREGLTGRGMCFHASADWLTSSGFDAAREGTVEILNMEDFLLWRAEQPMMTLHELAHAYHWRLGFERADVREVYQAAKNAGLYTSVAYTLSDGPRPAYALGNEREYFAELSEALFGRNDYAPCTREELAAYDPGGLALVERLWGLSQAEISAERASADE